MQGLWVFVEYDGDVLKISRENADPDIVVDSAGGRLLNDHFKDSRVADFVVRNLITLVEKHAPSQDSRAVF